MKKRIAIPLIAIGTIVSMLVLLIGCAYLYNILWPDYTEYQEILPAETDPDFLADDKLADKHLEFDPKLIDGGDTSVWRYRRLYGLAFETPTVRLGAGGTPLLPVELEDRQVWLKPEYFAPTASFKDRGTAVMINILAHQGVTHVADDSSGNAGASDGPARRDCRRGGVCYSE